MSRKRTKNNRGIKLIKKSNQLIESRYKFDIWETRVFLTVLANIRRDDEDFKAYRIWYKDVIKTFGLRSAQSYEFLRTAARGLMRKVFYVSEDSDGHRRETEYHIIRSVNYLAEGEKGGDNQEYLDITIDPEMKPLLLQLGQKYTAYDLRNVIKLGAYHLRVYELLKQYQTIGHRKLEVDAIKTMLEITTEYPLFGNFFQKIIKPSVDAINKHSDLTITKLEKLKTGRKVTALYFEFHQKTGDELKFARGEGVQQQLPLNSEKGRVVAKKAEKDRLFTKFQEVVVSKFGVTPTSFMALLDRFTEEQVHQAIRVTRRANYHQQVKSNIAGFFIKALKEGYTDPKEEAQKGRAAAEKEKQQRAAKASAKSSHSKKVNEIIRAITKENPEITAQAIAALSDNYATKAVLDQKETELGRSLTVEDFRKYKVLREMVKGKIMEMEEGRFSG